MTDLQTQAREYAEARLEPYGSMLLKAEAKALIEEAYEQGWVDRDTSMWLPFKTDKDGFADEQFLDNMLALTPFVVRYQDGTIIAVGINYDDWYEWIDEIRKTPQRFKWMQLPRDMKPETQDEFFNGE